jgi:AcrR family transcriptional regulator
METVEVTERIIVESGQLFGKYGIRSMTMDALAEKMGISKRTIYERFKDKDTLLLEVIKYYKKQSSDQALVILDEADNAIEAMFRIMKLTISQIEQLNPVFFNDFRKYHMKVFNMLAGAGSMRDYSITRKLLETGVKQKIFREELNLEIVNLTLHQLFDLFGHESKLVDAGYHRKEMFDHIMIPYYRGISTEKGVTILEDCKSILD